MKRYLYIIGIGLGCLEMLSAQSLRGRVVNGAGKPIEGVTVVLQKADSTFIEVSLTDTAGMFQFRQEVLPCRYILQHVAYETREIEKATLPDTADVYVLKEQNTTLEDLVITAEKPYVQVEEGKLSYDLTALSDKKMVDNAYEAITKLPGITERNGALSLAGATSLTVILNGRPTTMNAAQLETFLKNTPVERVERAEVMYSAPPEYHVRGAAVNVVLKHAAAYHFSGEVAAHYKNQYFNAGGLSGNLRYTTPKWGFDWMYEAKDVKTFTQMKTRSLHTFGNQLYDIQNQEAMREKGWDHTVRSALEYNFSDKEHLQLAYLGSFSPSDKGNSHTTGNFQLSNLDKETEGRLHNLSVDYEGDKGLKTGIEYTRYQMENGQWLHTDYAEGNAIELEIVGAQKIDRLAAHADQSYVLRQDWELGFGFSYQYAHSRDEQIYREVVGDVETRDTYANLHEHTANVYASLDKKLKTGSSVSLSAMGEYYRIGGYERWAVFPRASLFWMLNARNFLQLALSSDKRYPEYWAMQSAISYIDGYSELHGSSDLRPANTYELSSTYIFRQKYMLTLFFNHTSDYFAQSPYQSSERLALIYKMQNWDFMRQYGASLSLPLAMGDWYDASFNAIALYMHERCDDFYDIPFNRKKWVGVLMLDNTFKVGKHLSFELGAHYQSPAIQGVFDINGLFNLHIAARYTFLKGRATLSVHADDLFNTGAPRTAVRFKGQHLDMDNSFYNRSVSVRLSYRLGSYKEKKQKQVDTSRFGH